MSQFRGHLQRFTCVFVRDVPVSGTSPTFYLRFRPRCPTSGDISNTFTVFSYEMSHFQGHFQRFDPIFVRDVPYPGTSPTLLPSFSSEMSHIRGHLQLFDPVFARDVPLSGTPPTFYPCFCTRCPTSGDISNIIPAFSHEMSHLQGHLQRFHRVFVRDVPVSGTPPTFYLCFRTRCPTFGDISNALTPFSPEMSHIQGHLQRFTPNFDRDVPHPGTPPTL